MDYRNKKESRRASIFAAIEALNIEIELNLEAVRALELIYFGRVSTGDVELIPKPAPAAEKKPRGSAPLKRKGPGKGRGRKNLSQTPPAKLARAYRAKQKAKADQAPAAEPAAAPDPGKAHSAHEALKDHSQAEVEKAKAHDFPPQRKGSERKASQASNSTPAAGNPGRKPTVPPVTTGSLTGIPQRDAIKAVLRRASRQLNSAEILDRLTVSGYHFNSQNPKGALSVALASMRGELMTERRAGRLYYDPIKGGELEGGN